jgi:hypothetical protein
MRTVRTKVYKFSELSKAAQAKAIEHYRNNEVDTSFIYDEAEKTVNAFHEVFGTRSGRSSWLDVYTDHIDDNLANLKGLRLRTYIINNFWSSLFKGKYYNYKSDTKERLQHKRIKSIFYKNLNSWGNYYYSAVTFENSCTLTGWSYDDSLLQPIYDFLSWKKGPLHTMNFETLMNDCFDNLKKDIKAEEDSQYEDEQIIERLENSDDEFTKDGNRF